MSASSNIVRIESLNKDNYDTWKMQMEALLVKNDAWNYVNGDCECPVLAEDNSNAVAHRNWTKADSKAKSDIILSISPSELKLVKGCTTSHQVWVKLQETYQSTGPARKATLLKQLTLHRMSEDTDVREHLRTMFDIVDKLEEMEVDINKDLLAIMILYSLPSSYENFRVAIESRDVLPNPESLRIKLIEESQARTNTNTRGTSDRPNDALFTNKNFNNFKKRDSNNGENSNNYNSVSKSFVMRCFRCKKLGHKANECKVFKAQQSAKHVAFVVSPNFTKENSDVWCLDSGASSHMCGNLNNFTKFTNSACGTLNLATDKQANITGKGTVILTTNNFKNGGVTFEVKDTLYVPDLRTNLLSVSKITNSGYKVVFNKDGATIFDSNGNTILNAFRLNDLYFVSDIYQSSIRSAHVSTPFISNIVSAGSCSTIEWHRKLGHLNIRDMVLACKNGYLKGVTIPSTARLDCEICARAKMTRLPFPKKSERKCEILEIIHSDLCGPMRTASIGGAKYVLTLTDDASKWTEVRFLRHKDECLEYFKEFLTSIENLKGKKIKYLQSDNGGEYISQQFDNFLKERGILRRLTVAHTPQQNGVAERKNGTLMGMARCLLYQAELPDKFWAEAVNTANFLRNRCPTQSNNGKSPFHVWNNKTFDLGKIEEFGSKVVILNKKPNKGKLEPRGLTGIFMGYAEFSKAYRVWIPENKKIVISRDVRFLGPKREVPAEPEKPSEMEEVIPVQETETEVTENILPGDVIIDEGDVIIDERPNNDQAEIPPRGHGRGRPRLIRTGNAGRPKKQYSAANNISTNADETAYHSEISMKDAMSGEFKAEWMEAMITEVKSILKNDTWIMSDRVDSEKTIGSRIVLRNKYKADGTLERRKARLVAQGFSQQPGVHFNETFAPVARMGSIRMLMAIAAKRKMKVHQFDVTTAYLNGKLNEKIFMEPPKQLPEILENISNDKAIANKNIACKAEAMLQDLRENKICLLNKSLYGLKQAGRSWHQKLEKTLKQIGAVPCVSDTCVFRLDQGEDVAFIITYVDDLIIISSNEKMINELNTKLSKEFEINNLGKIGYCLGVEFSEKNSEIRMSQKGYVLDLLTRFNMQDAKPVVTPMEPGIKLVKCVKPDSANSKEVFVAPYRELIGALTYLAITTRPDISYAVSKLAQYNNAYDKSHWIAAKRVLRYLKGTSGACLVFKETAKPIEGFVDSDWGGDLDDRKSQTGHCFMWNGSPIFWESRKQKTVALSTNEAEYMALTDAIKQALHIRAFLDELGMPQSSSMRLHVDNMGALKMAENPVLHGRSKHIDIRYHFIREVIKNKQVSLQHISTTEMLADVLTKPLVGTLHYKCIKGLKIV